MKALKRACRILPAIFAAALLALTLWAGLTPPVSVSAASSMWDFTIETYTVKMDVKKDRTIGVEEIIKVYFNNNVHGIIRDFPLGGGTYYRNLKATCDHPDFSPYIETENADFLSYYLRGEGLVGGQYRTYTLTYELSTPALSDRNEFPIDVLGYGWYAEIENLNATVTLPGELTHYNVYSGRKGSKSNAEGADVQAEGNTLIVTAANLLPEYDDGVAGGITLDLHFEGGVLGARTDLTPLWAALVGLVVLGAAFLVKFLFCRQPDMVLTVNLSAPDEMDPFLMGKLIDNQLDAEDYGAVVFWLASKGYLFIDYTEDKDHPTLYRAEKPLAPDMPTHCRLMYEALFKGRESVKISDLGTDFYRTAEGMKASAQTQAGKMYKRGVPQMVLFGVLAALLLGSFAFLYSWFTVAAGYFYWTMFPGVAFAFVPALFCSNIAAQKRYRMKKWKLALLTLGGALGGLLISCFMLLFPSAAMGRWAQFTLSAFAAATGAVSGFFLTRTEEYTQKLGHVLGFRQFILVTEKDKIEFMLGDNPELYYDILPYAQVLGVTDAWTDKFKGITLNPPSYVNYTAGDFVFDCIVWNACFRALNAGFVKNMITRPSSSGGKGFGGGSFGGFGGGGFGGGGGRSC